VRTLPATKWVNLNVAIAGAVDGRGANIIEKKPAHFADLSDANQWLDAGQQKENGHHSNYCDLKTHWKILIDGFKKQKARGGKRNMKQWKERTVSLKLEARSDTESLSWLFWLASQKLKSQEGGRKDDAHCIKSITRWRFAEQGE